MVAELVHQDTGQQTDIGEAPCKHRSRGRDFPQAGGVLVPPYRAAVLEHHITARTLGQTTGDLVIDHLVLIGIGALELGGGEFDHFDRHIGAKAQAGIGHIVGVALLWLTPPIGDLFGRRRLGRRRDIAQQGAEIQLMRMFEDALLGLAPEQLPLEPVELLFEGSDFCSGLFKCRLEGLDHSRRIDSRCEDVLCCGIHGLHAQHYSISALP